MRRHGYDIHRVDLVARTTRSSGRQNTLGVAPNPINPLDIVNKESLRPQPAQGLHAVRWFCTSNGPDQQVNYDPLGRPFSGTSDQFPGTSITLRKVHLFNLKASRAGLYVVLRKNGSNVETWNIPKGTGVQHVVDVSYTQHAGPPITFDLGAFYVNGTAAGGNTYGLILVEYDIDFDV